MTKYMCFGDIAELITRHRNDYSVNIHESSFSGCITTFVRRNNIITV